MADLRLEDGEVNTERTTDISQEFRASLQQEMTDFKQAEQELAIEERNAYQTESDQLDEQIRTAQMVKGFQSFYHPLPPQKNDKSVRFLVRGDGSPSVRPKPIIY